MQKEFKLVLFNPTSDRWAADIYEDNNRVHCGRGWKTDREAVLEATEWLLKNFGIFMIDLLGRSEQ